ncbi:hypothetical protein [Celeribacter sp.]|uniref:hypothetical protein n=1 Tax=Celeribacter sp. TaxID=1890673 RepID=UPI003A937A9D
MIFLGLFLLIVGTVLAYTFHYFEEVRRRNQYGVLEVDGFKGYSGYLLRRVVITIFLLMIMLPGLGLFLYGLVNL